MKQPLSWTLKVLLPKEKDNSESTLGVHKYLKRDIKSQLSYQNMGIV
jgi:hypothetical protein